MLYALTFWSLVLRVCTTYIKIKLLDMLSMLCICRFYVILTINSFCLLYNINWLAFIKRRLFSLFGRHWMIIQIIFSPYHFYPLQQTSQRWPIWQQICVWSVSLWTKDGCPFGCGTLVLPVCHSWHSSLSTLLMHVCQVLRCCSPPYHPQHIPLFLLPFQPLHTMRDTSVGRLKKCLRYYVSINSNCCILL